MNPPQDKSIAEREDHSIIAITKYGEKVLSPGEVIISFEKIRRLVAETKGFNWQKAVNGFYNLPQIDKDFSIVLMLHDGETVPNAISRKDIEYCISYKGSWLLYTFDTPIFNRSSM